MEREKLSAIYGGECYINAYGRKLYKKGILLKELKDKNGNVLFEKIKIPKTKDFCGFLKSGDKIVISAEIIKDTLRRVKIEEVYNHNV